MLRILENPLHLINGLKSVATKLIGATPLQINTAFTFCDIIEKIGELENIVL